MNFVKTSSGSLGRQALPGIVTEYRPTDNTVAPR